MRLGERYQRGMFKGYAIGKEKIEIKGFKCMQDLSKVEGKGGKFHCKDN